MKHLFDMFCRIEGTYQAVPASKTITIKYQGGLVNGRNNFAR